MKELQLAEATLLCGAKLATMPNEDGICASGGFYSQNERTSNSTDDFTDRAIVYSPMLDAWHELAAMQKKRMHHLPFVYNDQLHVIGGDIHFLNRHTIERYDPDVDAWQYVNKSRPFKCCIC